MNVTFASSMLSQMPLKIIVKSVLFSFLLMSAVIVAQAQNCTHTATGNNINVASGEVVCVISDLIANVDIASGGTLKIQPGVTLTIQNFNNFNGTLINNGTVIAGNINFGTGAIFTNYNQAIINGNQNYNGTAIINNVQLATLTINSTFSLGSSSTINNDGTFISTNGDVSFNSGTINNNGRFEVQGGNFNPNGTVNNNGFFKVDNFINLNGGTVYNKCRFVVGNGFNVNNTNIINDGLIWVTNTSTGKVQHNSGTWVNTMLGKVRVHDFINSAIISGSGEFYFTGDTRQQGTFEGSYSHADSAIKVYDATYAPNIAGSAFDFGIQGAHVVRSTSLAPADTNSFGGSCALQTFGFTPLSLDLLEFDIVQQSGAVLLNWETTKEDGVHVFEVEHSNDGASWRKAGSVNASGNYEFNNYHFAHYDVKAGLNLYRLKMIDIDGKFTYSPVKSIVIKNNNGSGSVYPNPFAATLNLEYNNTNGTSQTTIQVVDIAGKLLETAGWNMTEGLNIKALNLNKLSGGIYFLVIRNNNDGAVLLHEKIIKN
jgi:adhesin HecA-like repeat protein